MPVTAIMATHYKAEATHVNQQPLVSVLINNYNYAHFLTDSIGSAQNQTYRNLEIIVVDDGSTDESRSLIQRIAEQDPRVVSVFKPNGGQASAYNAGVKAARGDVLCFLDADDTWHPEKVVRVVDAHRTHGFVQHEVEKNGQSNFTIPYQRFDRNKLVLVYGYLHVFSPSSALSLRRDLAGRVFPIPEPELRLCADIVVMLTATYYGRVHTLPEILGHYRIHETNQWQQAKAADPRVEARKYYECLELVNRRLFERGEPPIPVHNWVQRERMLADVLETDVGGRYYVYGAGGMGKDVAQFIRDSGGTVVAFVDSSEKKWGQTAHGGALVISPEELKKAARPDDRIVVANYCVPNILETLRQHGIPPERVLYPPYRRQEA